MSGAGRGGVEAVALGGGHGLHATLSALRLLADKGLVTERVTAVVTVADDGGSSGRLRRIRGASRARRVVVLNLAPEPGETAGFSPEQHLAVLSEHAPALRVDAVLADVAAVPVPERLYRAAVPMLSPGGCVHLAAVAPDPGVPRHDPVALAGALGAVLALSAHSPEPGRRSMRWR